MKNLKYLDQALLYHSLGLNTISIGSRINENNYNDNNLLKAPNHDCKNIKTTRQTIAQLLSIDWDSSSGVGCILGFDNLFAIDIDGCNQVVVVRNICRILGFPDDYEWVIRTGSGDGFHILFKCLDKPTFSNKIVDTGKWNIASASKKEFVFGAVETNAYYPFKTKRVFTKIEFKWEGNIVLPPSLHLTGNQYSYLNNIPNQSPFLTSFKQLKMVKEFYGSTQAIYSDWFNMEHNWDDDDNSKFIIQAIAEKDEELYNFKTRRIEPYFIFFVNYQNLISRFETSSNQSRYVIQVNWLVLDKNYNVLKRHSFNYLKEAKKIVTKTSLDFENIKDLITKARSGYLEFINDLQHATAIVISNQTQLNFIHREILKAELYLDAFTNSTSYKEGRDFRNEVKDKPLIFIDKEMRKGYQTIYELYFDFLSSNCENTIDALITEKQIEELSNKFLPKKVDNRPNEDVINVRDSTDDYGNWYEKYGGYNGWSDDVIDDAFEGDPDLTWNVD